MKERLSQFLKSERLNPSRFAETMNIQPSSVSHIISGRNKPGFDFIEKILRRFPNLNPDWLILGILPMYRVENGIAKDKSKDGPPNGYENYENLESDNHHYDQKTPDLNAKLYSEIDRKSIEKVIILYKDATFSCYYT